LKIENINISEAVKSAEILLKREKLSPALKAMFQLLLTIVTLLVNRLNLNSSNSSKPPSSDPNRKKKRTRRKKSDKNPGAQNGHKGVTLEKVNDPDVIEALNIDRRTLPRDEQFTEVGYESRQVFDIEIKRIVTEYRAQILEDSNGKQYTATFPEGISNPTQYGVSVKSHSVYMSVFQLIPYERVSTHFRDQMNLPLSKGSVFNFNREAYKLLETFDDWLVSTLVKDDLLHVDETGINISGQRYWLHTVANESFAYFYPHKNRGTPAMKEMGVLEHFAGTLVHDHWKPYYTYDACAHALCNAHHLRELKRAFEQDKQKWADKMCLFLEKLNDTVSDTGGVLPKKEIEKHQSHYRAIILAGEKECPAADEKQRKPGARGRLKQSKARNLLERLRNFEDDVLRFMAVKEVPFTNNLGENAIRMTKVQQKISGCFRSIEGAKIFCRIRSFILTCQKQEVNVSTALRNLFEGKLPDFIRLIE